MPRLIDADELKEIIEVGHLSEMSMKNVNYINGYSTVLECAVAQVEEAETVNAIIIPTNATNGDMIKAMFPNAEIEIHEANEVVGTHVSVSVDENEGIHYYSLEWWYAPYKKSED